MQTRFAHTPWDGSHPLFRIGLSPLGDAPWLEPDENLAAHLALKERLLAERRADVFGAQPGTADAQAEALAAIADHLPARHPDIWRRQGDAVLVTPAGRTVDLAADAPLVAAARLVQEDLALMRRDAHGWRLAAGCVCFPSSWRLREKLGRPMHEVHAPVPGFGGGTRNATLIERIFDNLQPGAPVARMNWSLYGDDALFHGDERSERERSGDLAQTFLRVERQTLTKLPVSGDILFTIRIHVDPASAIAGCPDRGRLATGLAASLRRLDEAELAYKGLSRTRGELLDRLDALARCS